MPEGFRRRVCAHLLDIVAAGTEWKLVENLLSLMSRSETSVFELPDGMGSAGSSSFITPYIPGTASQNNSETEVYTCSKAASSAQRPVPPVFIILLVVTSTRNISQQSRSGQLERRQDLYPATPPHRRSWHLQKPP